MIKSMTGYGRSELVFEDCKIIVEIKAVNHRYCDLSIKIPKKLNSLETVVRNYVKKSVNRGKIDVFINYEDLSEKASVVKLNEDMGQKYYEALSRLSELLHISNDATALKIARLPEVLSVEESQFNPEDIEGHVLEAVEQALVHFSDSRIKEGTNLKIDILNKLEGMKDNISEIERRYPQMIADYRKKLEDKVRDLLETVNIDESRIATEVVIYADKICVDEETVRLRSHISSMKDEMKKGGNIGRKLDFIAQEMNREANTILSKANDITISNKAIDLKTEIEKIREQVQNIE